MKSAPAAGLQRFAPKADLPAALVVFLVALPLCLGIALASGAPLFAGIVAGIVGGVVVGSLSGSALSVSGPAAGLTVIVLAGIERLGGYPAFCAAAAIAGVLQIGLGFARAGMIADFFPVAVIRGMLAAIGLILILKQVPHALGWDADYEGDESFFQLDGKTTFTELFDVFEHLSAGAITLSVLSLALLIAWETPLIKKIAVAKLIPGALVAVGISTGLAMVFESTSPTFAIADTHFVSLPTPQSFGELIGQLHFPDFSALARGELWIVAVTIAIVASLETLLCADAADKLDPLKRATPTNRELKAQGVGNVVSALLGGLPITAVIVRSSANIAAGARSKLSAIVHGLLLLVAVVAAPHLLNRIPLASLAAVLLVTGYKLCKPSIVREMWSKGYDQFVPFAVTILAILFTDLLRGIFCGMLVGIFFILRSNFRQAITVMRDGDKFLISMNGSVSFLNKAHLRRTFNEVPNNAYVLIDGTRAGFIDKDIIETLRDFVESAEHRLINVELKRSPTSHNPVFKTETASVDYSGGQIAASQG